MLERLLRLRLTDWMLPIAICITLAVLFACGPEATRALRYERAAVVQGEWWRLVTGHLVHADAGHLLWNLSGVVLVWWLFAGQYTVRGWLSVLWGSTVAIDLGFLLWLPSLEWYVGFSGVLHGAMAAGLLAWLARHRDGLTMLVAVLFAAKLAWEHVVGPLPFTAQSIGLPVIHQAHTYGAIGGALTAAMLLVYRSRRRASL